MRYINGGEVASVSSLDEYEFISRKNRHLLVQHRSKKFSYLADRMVMVNSDLRDLLSYVRDEVSENWYKTIKGRIIGMLLIRYVIFSLYPQQYGHRGELILYANYSIIKNYLQRIVKVLICNYDYPDKYYRFKIEKNDLYQLSQLFYDRMEPTVTKVMVPHYKRLTEKSELSKEAV